MLAKGVDLEKILDNTPVLLTRCTSDLRYLYVSKAYASMLGRAANEISGKRIIDVVGPEWFETIRPHVELVLRGQRVEYEATLPFVGVGPRHVHVTYVPECDDQGQVVGWIASITDITEQKKATEQLTHMLRVSTLAGLSGAIAHELSQPLASILANAQAAQVMVAAKNPDLEELANILEEIVQDDTRAEQVIRTLRRLLKRGEHSEALINLNELIASTLQLLRSELLKRQVNVNADLQSELPQISGDSVELPGYLSRSLPRRRAAWVSGCRSARTSSDRIRA